MPPREVLVTYTFYPSGSHDLHHAVSGINAQLPLRNLHWKSQTRTSLRTIQELEVRLLELGDVPPNKDHVAGSVLVAPLDSEIYKNNTKSFIRDWLSLLASRRNVNASLIVLVNPPNPGAVSVSSKNVFGRDKGILGKLKTDFNVGKRDRCVQVNLPPVGNSDPAAWPEVINKLKESIVFAFDGAIIEREDEVKRGESQQMTIGWNFCTWFLLKESLAHSFEGVNLFEDALLTYEELEASFFQVLKEQNLTWFGKLGAAGPLDDSLSILDTSVKQYRDLLQTSTISIFDFRIYVFARQCALLGKLGRITEIAKRGQWFVASLTRRLRENEADLAEHFIESWTYTACLDIVQKCDEWSRLDRANGDYSGLIAYESARAELLDIARVQVERIGVSAGHLPNIYPFSPSTTLVSASDDVLFESSDNGLSDKEDENVASHSRPSLSNRQILDAQGDRGKFQTLYLSLTKKAVTAYEACGKVNSVIRLKANLTGLAIHNQDFATAYELSRDLAKACAELRVWEPVSKYALKNCLISHQRLSKSQDEDWANLALAFMRLCAITPSDTDDGGVLQAVLEGLRSVSNAPEVESHSAFGIKLKNDRALPTGSEDGTEVIIEVENFLAMTSVQNLFQLQVAEIVVGSVVFDYDKTHEDVLLRVRRSTEGIKTVLRMPYLIALDEETKVVLEIATGQSGIKNAKIALEAIHDDVHFITERASCDTNEISGETSSISIGEIPAHQHVTIAIPYSGVSQGDSSPIRIDLDYTSSEGDLRPRSYKDAQSVSMGLPLTVNVQDFFRPSCVVSNFTIASDGIEYLRIGKVSLEAPKERFEVESCNSNWENRLTLTPDQPLACLFKVKPVGGQASSVAEVLRLVIQYRSLEEESQMAVDEALSQTALSLDSRDVIKRTMETRLSDKSAWLQTYLATGSLAQTFSPEWMDGALLSMTGLKREDLMSAVNVGKRIVIASSLYSADNEKTLLSATPALLQWRTLEIPVDVPQRRVLTTIRVEHLSPDGLIYEGRALSMNIRLQSNLTWAGSEASEIHLVFDIQPQPEDWLILGKKKGFYIANPDVPEEQQIVMVPMRAGALSLPTISIIMLPGPSNAKVYNEDDRLLCDSYVENAAQIINVLPAKTTMTTIIPTNHGSNWEGERS
ncbi:trafficking protein particle complex subunit 10, partial [Tremellales sp. Uapishka_1]